ncbi:MAG: serine/threonine-protein phosphatase [Clostridia bacterium]|nr:serine/threonine-protein phosphatase [Clostridia bacterium]
MQFIQSYYTDIGVKRKTNQDSLALIKADTDFGEVLLAVMCDGMGGHQSGELASKTIVVKFEKWFKTEFPVLLYKGVDESILKECWSRLIEESNSLLVKYGKEKGVELGSTLTAFLFIADRYYAVHVGDSRGYEISEDAINQITRDHSLLADAVRKGIMTEEEASKDSRKNILLECVGITDNVKVDFYSGNIKEKHTYLLCSDGFWHFLDIEDYTHYLSGERIEDNKMLRMHLNFLVETVKQRGEKDNISVIGVIPLQNGV